MNKDFICPNRDCCYWDEEYTQDCIFNDGAIEDYCPFVKGENPSGIIKTPEILQRALELSILDEEFPYYKRCPLETFCTRDYCAYSIGEDNYCYHDGEEHKCWANYYIAEAEKNMGEYYD